MSTHPADAVAAVATLGTLGFAVTALVRPAALSGAEDSSGSRYYAAMYAVRAVPLGLAALAALASGRGRRGVLLAAAGAQAGDALIGVWRRQPGQVVAPALLAGLYAWRSRDQRATSPRRLGHDHLDS